MNPAKYVKKYPEKPRERYLSSLEAQRLLNTLNEFEGANKENPHALALIRLLWVTGARISEILTAKWEWVDYKRSTIELPDSKTGRRSINLNTPALEILSAIPRVGNNPYILPSPQYKNRPLSYPSRIWDLVRAKAKLKDFRIHDLRHSFASLGIEAGLTLPEIGNLLGHKEMRTTQRYAHLKNSQAQCAVNRVGDLYYRAIEDNNKAGATNAGQ